MCNDEEWIKKKCELLIQAGILTQPGQGFSLRQNGSVWYISDMGTLVKEALKNKIGTFSPRPVWLDAHRAVYRKNKGIRSLIQSSLPYTMTAARAGQDVPPLLDDFAQLVGVTARVVKADPMGKGFPKQVANGMIRRNAVLIPEWGGLCGAGTFDDAMAVAQVLEKGCQALVDTAFLGGGHRISRIESWLMRLVYRYKYSRTAG